MITIQVPGITPEQDKKQKQSLHDTLLEEYEIEVPVFTFQNKLFFRISFHIYNNLDDTLKLGKSVLEALNVSEKAKTVDPHSSKETSERANRLSLDLGVNLKPLLLKHPQSDRLKNKLLDRRKSRIESDQTLFQ